MTVVLIKATVRARNLLCHVTLTLILISAVINVV